MRLPETRKHSAPGAEIPHYPFFSIAAQRLVLQGEDVQVFEYPNATAADRDASNVSPSGSPIGQSQIAWMDPFAAGR